MAALADQVVASEEARERERIVEFVVGRVNSAEKGVHKRYVDKAVHLYGLYRNVGDWARGLSVDRRDRDMGLADAASTWGTELFIPYSYSTVETILPRMLSHRPNIVIFPRGRNSEENVENVKFTIQSQQEKINYEIVVQRIARDALIGGLGVQKTYWKFVERNMPVAVPSMQDADRYVKEMQRKVLFDDPVLERVEPLDFIWDPYADSMETCEWACHRTWRSADYAKKMLASGKWSGVEAKDLEGQGSGAKYAETFERRQSIGGYNDLRPSNDVHEVWEYHDGEQVITIVDRQHLVQRGPNPAWHGELPFQVFRPTIVNGQLAGIGEIEPMEDLQAEANIMRSQRRDNATVVLQKSFFYADGMIDPSDFKIGPGRGIPTLGDPREAVMPIQFGEIPNSTYREMAELQADIERTTGIDDSLSGSGGSAQTATGVQLVQAAANERIKQKTRNCEIELVRAGGRQMLALNQQKILTSREIPVPAEPQPGGPDRRWTWLKIGPKELAGEFAVDVEGGSMAPENIPQQRSDAQMMATLMQQLPIDPKKAGEFILRNLGVKDPQQWMIQPEATVPAAVMDEFQKTLEASGVDKALLAQAQAAVMSKGQGQ